MSLIGMVFLCTFAQPVAERNALIEHKTFAAPAALRFGHAFEIFQDPALEAIDLGKTPRQQIAAGLFAPDAAAAEHRDLPVFRRIEMPGGKFPKLPEALDAGIERAGEGAHSP